MPSPREPRPYNFSDYFKEQIPKPNELRRLLAQLEVPDLLADLVNETGLSEDEIMRLVLSRELYLIDEIRRGATIVILNRGKTTRHVLGYDLPPKRDPGCGG